MRFYREISVGCLNEISTRDTADFRCHGALVVQRADVFNDRIGEAVVEVSVAELRKMSRISCHRAYGQPSARLLRYQIDDGKRNVIWHHVPIPGPKVDGATDVEDVDWLAGRQHSDE